MKIYMSLYEPPKKQIALLLVDTEFLLTEAVVLAPAQSHHSLLLNVGKLPELMCGRNQQWTFKEFKGIYRFKTCIPPWLDRQLSLALGSSPKSEIDALSILMDNAPPVSPIKR